MKSTLPKCGSLENLNHLQGTTLYENVYGDKEANNAGEYLSVDSDTGELMVYCDSDTVGGGFAFLKLLPS